MSQENVEVVRRFLLLGVDEALTLADPDIVWNPAEEAATYGHDAVRDSLVRWKSEWDDYELLPEGFEDVGDCVVAAVRLRGRGRGRALGSSPIDLAAALPLSAQAPERPERESAHPKPRAPSIS